jgi:hypothetical protein
MSRIINKRCNVCDINIKYGNYWAKHCKTKKHLRNLKEIQKDPVEIQKDPIEIQKRSNRDPVEIQSQDINIEIQCKYCNKQFKHKTNKYRHQLYRCKLKPKETQVVNNNTNSHNTNTNSHNTLTNTTNNTTNQITLNVYGQEKIPKHFLTDDLFEKLKLCNGDLTKTYLLLNNELYLKNKQNNNIKYTNIQSEYCQILSKDNNWILKRLLEVMNERGITIREELEIEMERIVEKEGIQNNTIIPHPKIEQCQIMYKPLDKFDEELDEEDEEIKELYKKYQIELYNLKKKKRKKQEIIHTI